MLAVIDIDGVVADVRHRLHHIERRPGRRPNWRAFFTAAARDPLLPEGARLVADLASAHDIVWLSGRPEWLRDLTRDWLARHALPGSELHLRPSGDVRPAPRYKLGVLQRLAPRGIAAVVDDDEVVVAQAVAAGFRRRSRTGFPVRRPYERRKIRTAAPDVLVRPDVMSRLRNNSHSLHIGTSGCAFNTFVLSAAGVLDIPGSRCTLDHGHLRKRLQDIPT